MSVGVGGVAAQLSVDKGLGAAAAVDGFVGAVLCVERYLGSHSKVGEEVLLAYDAFAVFVVAHGLDGGGALQGEGA